MILILSHPQDIHAQRVMEILKAKNIEFKSFSFSFFPIRSSIDYQISSKESSLILTVDNQKINLREVTSVLARRPHKAVAHSRASKMTGKYIEEECNALLSNLEYLMPNTFWISSFNAMRIANKKPYQLFLASEVGFLIPPTYIGNNSECALSFSQQYPELALKYLYRMVYSLDANLIQQVVKMILSFVTTLQIKWQPDPDKYLTENTIDDPDDLCSINVSKLRSVEIRKNIDKIKYCPVILQQYIPKQIELRVTVIGKKVFCCALQGVRANLKRGVE